MRRTSFTAALPLLVLLSACSTQGDTSSTLTGLDPLPARRVAAQFENLPNAYVVHIRNVGFVRRGTASFIGFPGGPEGFDFDLPEDTITDTWLLVGPEQPLNLIGITRDAAGVFLVRTSTDDVESNQEHVPTGTSASYEVSGEDNRADFAGTLSEALLTEAARFRAGVEDETFWTRPSEESDRLLIGESHQTCGRNNERLPETSRIEEVWADDFTPTGVSMCIAGPPDNEALLERTETGFEVLPIDEWEAIRAFVFDTTP